MENAIEHGIRGLEGYKRLRLSVREEEDRIIVEVEDNGVGMSAEKIERLMQETEQFHPVGERGIGLHNVINRLRLYYGTEDAVMIYSEGKNKGTRIQIRIPREVQDVSDHAGR
ncbi:sensor histidine kinase [Butyricicoccus porcorum]|nr:ATP-binding protein [Butyricicoccus porcorum]MDD6987404.1 ATP-binding protein [Butyricicoccus porcorum]MDY4483830.1 ATP-binding protein [Butyricicoccus porcorum]